MYFFLTLYSVRRDQSLRILVLNPRDKLLFISSQKDEFLLDSLKNEPKHIPGIFQSKNILSISKIINVFIFEIFKNCDLY